MKRVVIAATRMGIAVMLMSALGCEGVESTAEDDTGGDADADADLDADSDADTDTGQGDCTPGIPFCMGDDVYMCTGPDNQSEFVETCEDPLVCINGMCVENNPCGQATANKSNVGCEYWAVDLDNTTPGQPYAVAVSNLDADSDAHVKVEVRTGPGDFSVVVEADVPSKTVHVFMLTGENVALQPQLNTVSGTYNLPNQAYRITSDFPVVAYEFNPYAGLQADNSDICTNDGSLLLAKSGLDMYYYVLSYPANAGNSTVNIVATEDGTTVEITPSSPIMAGGTVPAMNAGQPYQFVMDAAQVLQLESASDVSGTYIEADKPVAVFGGNTCAFVPSNVYYCDHLEHQLFPLTTWGMEFVAARSVIRSTYQAPENDYFRIIASVDGTHVTTTPAVNGIPAVMNAGQVVEVGVNHSFRISSDEPIMVGQFLTGHEATDVDFYGAGGDPAFALLPPVEQFMTSYVFLAPEKYLLDYAVITHPAGQYPLLDGAPVAQNQDCETEAFDADWSITRCLIADFTHTLDSADGAGITVWGYGGRVSYGYTGGVDLETINPIVPE